MLMSGVQARPTLRAPGAGKRMATPPREKPSTRRSNLLPPLQAGPCHRVGNNPAAPPRPRAAEGPGASIARTLAASLAALAVALSPLDADASSKPPPPTLAVPDGMSITILTPPDTSTTPPAPTTLELPVVASRPAPLTPEEQRAVALYRRAEAGVVWVSSLTPRPDALTSALENVPAGAGSGIVWDRAGHIVTNAHVVRGAAAVRVRFLGGAEYDARVIGTDPDRDVAVLAVLGVDPAAADALFKPLPLGTSAGLQVGQRVYAIGNPFGLERSFNTGILSGVGREVPSGVTARPINGMLQIEAPINPGNSGGAALNSAGQLIGMPTAIYSASGSSAGVGFAVPVDTVASSANALIRTGKVVRPLLGISLAPEPAAESLGVKGVLILGVSPEGAAASAGLRPTSRDEFGRPVFGDIIRGFNGAAVESPSDLYRQLDKLSPGDEVPVKVLRGSGEETVTVKLKASA